tara:strand:+ start:4119 stop:5153 length:1035 start_codon:yes stop_codon:yes gene_type:complete
MEKTKYFLLISILIIFSSTYQINVQAQDIKKWESKIKINPNELSKDSIFREKGTIVNLGFNRVGLYNWSGGGQNSMSINGFINSFLNFNRKKTSWKNQLAISFGVLKTGYGNQVPWMKNDDRIEITSKFGRKTSSKWDYSTLFNFRTQFTYGYNSEIELEENKYFSSFFAPAFPLLAMGFNYNESDNLSCFISPATMKGTIVLDDSLSSAGVFGVDQGKNLRLEAGGYLNFTYKEENLFKINDLDFKTNLTLFSNYVENPQNIDITWETLTSFKFKKLFSITFSTYLIYDDDIKIARFNKEGNPIYLKDENGENQIDGEGNLVQQKSPLIQFKEAFSLGLMFNF